jgi:uncharacterized protein
VPSRPLFSGGENECGAHFIAGGLKFPETRIVVLNYTIALPGCYLPLFQSDKFNMTNLSALQVSWINYIVARPAVVLVITMGLSLALAIGVTGLGLSASPREYQGLESPRTKELIRLEQAYSRNNNILVMFSVEHGTVFEPQTLHALRFFTENAWQLPMVERVDSITNFQYSHADGDDLIVEDLVPEDPLSLTEEELRRIREVAISEPRLSGFLVSPDGRSSAVNMTFNVELDDSASLLMLQQEVDALIAQTKQHQPMMASHKTGFLAVCLGWLNAMSFDVQFMFTSAFLIMCIALYVFFRSVLVTTATMLLGITSVVASLGLVGYFDAKLHPPALIGSLVILMLALADSIHVVKRARKLVADGGDPKQAIAESLRFNFKPVFITSLTTAVGFISFLASDYAGMRLMGIYVAFGVMYACLLSLTFLPAVLTWLPLKPGASRERILNVELFASWIFRLRWIFVVLTIPVIIAGGFVIAHTPLDDSPIHYISTSQPYRQDQMVIEDRLTGSIEVVIELDSGAPRGVSDPEFMAEVEQFSSWLRAQPEVRSVSTYTDTMKHLNRNMHGERQSWYRLPDQHDLAAQYLLLYELSLPYGLDLTNQINLDKSATRLSMTMVDMTAVEMLALSNRMESWLQANTAHIAASKPGGDTLSFSIASLDSLEGMFYGALFALIVIGIILLLTFRQVMPGTLCVIMVISPLSVSFGIWSLQVGFLDAGSTLTMSMVIGIVVDNAVHFVSKYQLAASQMNMAPREAVKFVLSTVSSALITNTLVLAAGFSILYFSAFTANAEMGILTVMSLLIGLVGTFTLLPSMLVIWGEWQQRRTPAVIQAV